MGTDLPSDNEMWSGVN